MNTGHLEPTWNVEETLRYIYSHESPEAVEACLQGILEQYAQPHRRWHTLRHVNEMLLFAASHPEGGSSGQAIDVIFHDVVYDPRSKTNEEDSYWYRESALRNFAPLTPIEAARRRTFVYPTYDPNDAIIATRTHHSSDRQVQVVLDADLEVLSRPWEQYLAYCRAIREEYDFLPDEDFRRGRADFMEEFLRRERIYFTDFMRDREARAQRNIQREINMLRLRQA